MNFHESPCPWPGLCSWFTLVIFLSVSSHWYRGRSLNSAGPQTLWRYISTLTADACEMVALAALACARGARLLRSVKMHWACVQTSKQDDRELSHTLSVCGRIGRIPRIDLTAEESSVYALVIAAPAHYNADRPTIWSPARWCCSPGLTKSRSNIHRGNNVAFSTQAQSTPAYQVFFLCLRHHHLSRVCVTCWPSAL